MANLTVTPGYTFTSNEAVTLAKLNSLGSPTVSTADVSSQDFETTETLTGAGACSLSKRVTLFNNTSGGPYAMTLAAGSYTGHEKFVMALNGSSSAVFNLTVSSAGNGIGVLVFPSAATARGVWLKWDGAAWQWVGTGDVYEEKTGDATASGFGTTVLDKASGTATLTLPAGTFKGQAKRIVVKTAGCTWTVSGTFANSVTSTTLVSTGCNALDLTWDGAAWQGGPEIGPPAAASNTVSAYRVQTAGLGWVDLVPAGAIMPFAMETVPSGWLYCNGDSLLRADYPRLFNAIGTVWGAADGTHFNLPDLCGRFIRGMDDGRARDPNAGARTASNAGGATGDEVGTLQSDALKDHTHGSQIWQTPGGATTSLTSVAGAADGWGNSGAVNSPNAGYETRPKNAAVYFCIKF